MIPNTVNVKTVTRLLSTGLRSLSTNAESVALQQTVQLLEPFIDGMLMNKTLLKTNQTLKITGGRTTKKRLISPPNESAKLTK